MSAPTLHELNEHYAQELELFSIWMKNQGMSRSSESAYLSDVRQFLSLYYPAALESSSKLDIMRFLSRCREQGAGDEARNRKLSALRAFYKALNEMEMIAVNPAALTAKSKQQKNRLPVYLEEAQLRRLFSAIEGKYRYRNGTILLLMAYAGLRVGRSIGSMWRISSPTVLSMCWAKGGSGGGFRLPLRSTRRLYGRQREGRIPSRAASRRCSSPNSAAGCRFG